MSRIKNHFKAILDSDESMADSVVVVVFAIGAFINANYFFF